MDLWVVPPPKQSKWFARLDWYLNWQLSRGLAFERQRPSVEFFRVLEEGGVTFTPTPVVANQPLMVIAHHRLPTSKCVVIHEPAAFDTWLQNVRGLAEKLHAKTLRIFLPTGATELQAVKIWKTLSTDHITTEFTTDEETTWTRN